MYRSYDDVNGIPPRIYRTPGEIRRDIFEISKKIESTSDMLNIRALLVDILVSDRSDTPETLIPDLEEAISEAREALDSLKRLNEELDSLEEELEEVRCLVRT